MAKRAQKGNGSVRRLEDGTWECIIQSKYLNPKTNSIKRIKRRAKTEKEAIKKCKMALQIFMMTEWKFIRQEECRMVL